MNIFGLRRSCQKSLHHLHLKMSLMWWKVSVQLLWNCEITVSRTALWELTSQSCHSGSTTKLVSPQSSTSTRTWSATGKKFLLRAFHWKLNQLWQNRLIEELMLLANMAVAKQLFDNFPDIALLRCHSPPHDKLMSELSKSLKSVGVDLDVSSSSSIHACLNNYISAQDPDMKAIGYGLSSLLAKPMAVSDLAINTALFNCIFVAGSIFLLPRHTPCRPVALRLECPAVHTLHFPN